MTPEVSSLLSKLTIIIPTYNRPLELERVIEYWRDTPIHVHILDGSEKPLFSLGVLQNAPSITYHHMPADKGMTVRDSIAKRILFGSKLSNTDFSAVGCDDDFYTISGLVSSLKILDKKHSIDAVSGRVLTYKRKRQLYWYHKYVPRANKKDLETGSIEKKLQTGSSWFFYAVCRTQIWQKFLSTCLEKGEIGKVNYICGDERLMGFLSKAMFRSTYIDEIQLIRQDTIIGKNNWPERPWGEFVRDDQNAEDVDRIAKRLASGFNEVTPIRAHAKNLELARDQIKLAREMALNLSMAQPKTKTLRSVLGCILFVSLPGLSIFSDRPRRLKYLWKIHRYKYSVEQQREVEEIEKLLMKPREELRLRADI